MMNSRFLLPLYNLSEHKSYQFVYSPKRAIQTGCEWALEENKESYYKKIDLDRQDFYKFHTRDYQQVQEKVAKLDNPKGLTECGQFALSVEGAFVHYFLFKNPGQIPVLADEDIKNTASYQTYQDLLLKKSENASDSDYDEDEDNLKVSLTDHYDYIFIVQPGKTNSKPAVYEIYTMLLKLKAFYQQEQFAHQRWHVEIYHCKLNTELIDRPLCYGNNTSFHRMYREILLSESNYNGYKTFHR